MYQGLASQLESLDGAFRRHPAPPAVAPSARVVLYCEGETDYLHIEAAMSALPTVLSGNGLEVVLKRNVKSGDSHLLKMLEVLKESPPEVPTVCVFDRDVPDTVRKVTDDAGGPRAWGKHVASLALPSGEGDQPDARVCMEMLYDEVTLQHEINGRRLYFRHEFDAGGWHKDGSKKYAEGFVKGSSLIMEGVSEQGKASGVALTKKAFAQAVRQAEPPFDNVDFSRFQRLFEDIAKAVKLSLGFSAGED